jgi:hypothetical protein
MRNLNPRLPLLRNLVDNGRRFPHLITKRMSGCTLHRMPSYFKPMRAKDAK